MYMATLPNICMWEFAIFWCDTTWNKIIRIHNTVGTSIQFENSNFCILKRNTRIRSLFYGVVHRLSMDVCSNCSG